MTPDLILTPTLARRLAVHCQGLAGPRLPVTPEGMMTVLRQIRCLQLDPIRAVERSHLLVLWSRLGAYDPAVLDSLLWEERCLFEYWAHAASIVLTEDYPIFRWQMENWGSSNAPWIKRARAWIADNESLREHVMAELEERGPLAGGDLEHESDQERQPSRWSNNRHVDRMIDYLWISGQLMVTGREGIRRLWDLTERCLPEWTPTDKLDQQSVTRLAIQHALRALGVGTAAHIKQHFTRNRYPLLHRCLDALVAEGQIVPVGIVDDEGHWPGPWYMHVDNLPLVEQLAGEGWKPRTTLLSPFDNLICDRGRTEMLWDYEFRSEIYVPKDKRQYGYYVLSILHGEKLIGRLDPRMDRKARRLTVNAVFAESDAPLTEETGQAIAAAVADLGHFLGAREVVYGEPIPEDWREALYEASSSG